MTKSDFIIKVSEKAGLTKKDAEAALAAVIASVEEVLAEGDKIQFSGFGTFSVKERAERVGRNPRTNKSMTIPAAKIPVFKASTNLKEKIAK